LVLERDLGIQYSREKPACSATFVSQSEKWSEVLQKSASQIYELESDLNCFLFDGCVVCVRASATAWAYERALQQGCAQKRCEGFVTRSPVWRCIGKQQQICRDTSLQQPSNIDSWLVVETQCYVLCTRMPSHRNSLASLVGVVSLYF